MRPTFILAFFLRTFSKLECRKIKPKQKAVSHWAEEMETRAKRLEFEEIPGLEGTTVETP